MRMRSVTAERRWLSVHLHFVGDIYSPAGDLIIRDVVEQFLRSVARPIIDSWFFVRYGDGGSHIRLRMLARSPVQEDELWELFTTWVRAVFPDTPVGTQPPDGILDRAPGLLTHVVRTAYVPEIARYGGVRALNVAEAHFCASSELALLQLRSFADDDRGIRLGRAMMAMIVLAHTWFTDSTAAGRIFEGYESGYLANRLPDPDVRARLAGSFALGFDEQSSRLAEFVEAVWERLTSGDELTDSLDAFRDRLRADRLALASLVESGEVTVLEHHAADTEQALTLLAPSYVHMTNNRLGVSTIEEAYLAHLIRQTLARLGLEGGVRSGAV